MITDWDSFEQACLTEPMNPADCADALGTLGVDCFFCGCDLLDILSLGFYKCEH